MFQALATLPTMKSPAARAPPSQCSRSAFCRGGAVEQVLSRGHVSPRAPSVSVSGSISSAYSFSGASQCSHPRCPRSVPCARKAQTRALRVHSAAKYRDPCNAGEFTRSTGMCSGTARSAELSGVFLSGCTFPVQAHYERWKKLRFPVAEHRGQQPVAHQIFPATPRQ